MENERDPHYYSHTRVDLIHLIPPGTRKILEVGCGAGMTGKALREKGFEKIVGIEINEEMAQGGRAFYDQIVIGDVEKIRLPFEKEYFDCILYGDVLEHLVNPWQVLKDHQAVLKKGGAIICSIPNVRNYRILKNLIFRGRWEYTDDGILDRSHLRFFTLDSIQGMLQTAEILCDEDDYLEQTAEAWVGKHIEILPQNAVEHAHPLFPQTACRIEKACAQKHNREGEERSSSNQLGSRRSNPALSPS